MQLSHLLQAIYPLPVEADRSITGLTLDSRRVRAGDLFFAYKGTVTDGRLYIADAICRGVEAILIEAPEETPLRWEQSVPLIPISQLAQQIGNIAARFNHHPAKKLRMIGVTGTNGKTSYTHFLAQAFQYVHISCGLMGTLGNGFYDALQETQLTTPDALQIQAILASMLQQGAQAVAMEVSSHSIDQGRVNDILFEIGVFTNLTQDHLDYHGTMENYAKVKQRFLTQAATQQVIINADDALGRQCIEMLAEVKPVFAYSIEKNHSFAAAIPVIYTERRVFSLQGMQADVYTPWGNGTLSIALVGHFNLSNVLAVLTTLCLSGVSFTQALAAINSLKPVAGRMQILAGHHAPLVVVDYSHTPDALEKALRTLRQHCLGRLICVFGCGGDRDPLKRPLMAQIAEQWADHIFVTNDNPRHENPEKIMTAILAGFTNYQKVSVELDRFKAIKNSIHCAALSDCVLIAGKGAEHYQQIGDEKIPFDDVEQATRCLEEWVQL